MFTLMGLSMLLLRSNLMNQIFQDCLDIFLVFYMDNLQTFCKNKEYIMKISKLYLSGPRWGLLATDFIVRLPMKKSGHDQLRLGLIDLIIESIFLYKKRMILPKKRLGTCFRAYLRTAGYRTM